uniref:DUF4729 domain-containing protein n=1 Tax=Glossina austeni TaxID=7395 RepID=A0A1A9VWH8_GLOAU
MPNNCKDCDRLQPKCLGTGPTRPLYNQPTMYDHFSKFRKLKQIREEDEFVNKRKEDLLRFSSTFTNFSLNRVINKDEFEQFSTQDIARFRRQLRMGNWDRFLSEQMPDALDSGKITLNQTTSNRCNVKLLALTRTPVKCPITACNRTISITSVLSHYLRDHSEDFGVQCQEILSGKRAILIFEPGRLEFRENMCLGVLAYGGTGGERCDCPAERGLCMHNSFLPKPQDNYDAHLAILIMACRTSWMANLCNRELEEKLINPKNVFQEMIVIWLASVQTTKAIHCTVTVYDKLMTSARSAIMQVRNLSDSQNPSVFWPIDANCIRLGRGEIQILSRSRTEGIHMEVMINEYEPKQLKKEHQEQKPQSPQSQPQTSTPPPQQE